jgi:hypothetical protein
MRLAAQQDGAPAGERAWGGCPAAGAMSLVGSWGSVLHRSATCRGRDITASWRTAEQARATARSVSGVSFGFYN